MEMKEWRKSGKMVQGITAQGQPVIFTTSPCRTTTSPFRQHQELCADSLLFKPVVNSAEQPKPHPES
ncbi:hypothetical protein EB796_009382 [Bugula neritina]|uniref:Uncharacterized protein n=1 Tax=Bugula neritina TaxID=10212 RepID=A0A7J7K275_BUGNE|nr:hypothetical protein EB796_009382 [Bugula neritina]